MANAFITITNITASSVTDFLESADQGAQNLRFVKRPSRVTWAMDATAADCELEIKSGERTIQERSRVDASGTASQMPDLQQKAQTFLAAAGEILAFRVRETSGAGTTDLNLYIDVTPIR